MGVEQTLKRGKESLFPNQGQLLRLSLPALPKSSCCWRRADCWVMVWMQQEEVRGPMLPLGAGVVRAPPLSQRLISRKMGRSLKGAEEGRLGPHKGATTSSARVYLPTGTHPSSTQKQRAPHPRKFLKPALANPEVGDGAPRDQYRPAGGPPG